MPNKATVRLHSSLTQLTRQEILGMLETRWWWEIDQTLSPRESLARETSHLIGHVFFFMSTETKTHFVTNVQIWMNEYEYEWYFYATVQNQWATLTHEAQ